MVNENLIKIDPENISSINNGIFEGWGTSLCWWANRIGYSNELSHQAAEAFFSLEKGIGLNIARYNIGGGDDPSHDHITRSDSNMDGFMHFDPESKTYVYDWNSDATQRNVLREIKIACPDNLIVEAFSNSPPYFMTESGCSSGAFIPTDDNLKSDCYDDFAHYLAEVTYNLQKLDGIKIQSLEPMNEPDTNFWHALSNKQEGCHFSKGESQSKIITLTREALDKKGLNSVLVAGTDETSVDNQIDSYLALSDQAKDSINRIDTHTYNGTKLSELNSLAAAEGKNLWMSEVDGSYTSGVNAGEMAPALGLAEKIIKDLNGLKPSAWILWQVIDSHVSQKGYNGKADGGAPDYKKGFWGLATANHDRQEIILTQKYYGFGQFTKFIRPGSKIIYTTSNRNIAAYDSLSKKLVIVAVNSSNNVSPYTYDLSGFSKTGTEVTLVRTSGNKRKGESLAQLKEKIIVFDDKTFDANLAPNSITTFIISNVEI